jgi:hypothetical protein
MIETAKWVPVKQETIGATPVVFVANRRPAATGVTLLKTLFRSFIAPLELGRVTPHRRLAIFPSAFRWFVGRLVTEIEPLFVQLMGADSVVESETVEEPVASWNFMGAERRRER